MFLAESSPKLRRVQGGGRFRARIRRRLASGALVASCCLSGGAWAQPSPARQTEAFRLVWSSSAGCGDGKAFLSELKSRTTLLRDAQREEHGLTLIVATFLEGSEVRGQLTLHKQSGEISVRKVPGSSCEEVESALALVAALMVDPLAASWEREPPKPPPRPETPPLPPPARSPFADFSLRLEQRLTARNAIAPRFTWGQGWGLMVTREAGDYRPSVAVSAQVARATTSATAGSAELGWAAAQVTLCPASYRPTASWDFRVCGAFQLGRLRGTGFRTASPARQSVLWSSVGLQVEGRYELLGPLWLGWEGALTFPFSRERFYLEPQEILHRIPSWGASFGLGLGLRFF